MSLKTRFIFVFCIFYIGISRLYSVPVPKPAEDKFLARAREINQRILNLDSHVDIPENYATAEVDPGKRSEKLQVDLVKMREGGLDCVFLAAFAAQGPLTESGYLEARRQAMTKIEAIRRLATQMYPDRIELAVSPKEVKAIYSKGKLAAVIGLENGYAIGKDLSLLKTYYDLGVRYITLCHVGHNDICDSSNQPFDFPKIQEEENDQRLMRFVYFLETVYSSRPASPMHGGLSDFGRQVVAEMNRLGIMIDVSHISPASFQNVIETSKAPVIASHSSCRALCDMPRDLDDSQLLALQKNGGVIQITAVPEFLKFPQEQRHLAETLLDKLGLRDSGQVKLARLYREDRAAYEKILELGEAGIKEVIKSSPPADVTDLVNHIDHAVKLIGIDHVGLGSDFDGGGGVKGFDNAAEAVNVTAELLRRGYSEKDIRQIWGGNLLRVWGKVEKVAAKLKAGSSR